MEEHAQKYWEAITQQELLSKLISVAREEEFVFIDDQQVWDVVRVAEGWARTGKAPLKSMRVDVEKGDLVNLLIWSRLCAKEFDTYKSEIIFRCDKPPEWQRCRKTALDRRPQNPLPHHVRARRLHRLHI